MDDLISRSALLAAYDKAHQGPPGGARKLIEEAPNAINDIGGLSDGYHTFNELYYQRCVLFAALVQHESAKAWKTKRHEDGELCFGGGWFLVSIDTREGTYGYHFENKYWDLFHCKELKKAKHWDGYTDKDVGRLMSL